MRTLDQPTQVTLQQTKTVTVAKEELLRIDANLSVGAVNLAWSQLDENGDPLGSPRVRTVRCDVRALLASVEEQAHAMEVADDEAKAAQAAAKDPGETGGPI